MEDEQNLKQKKIALVQSEHAPVILELMKDCITQGPLVGETEWETIVNTITLEAQSTMLKNVIDRIELIKQGKLHEE